MKNTKKTSESNVSVGGIPFIYQILQGKKVNSYMVNLVGQKVSGDYKGVSIAGIENDVDGDCNGVGIAGIINYVYGDCNGVGIAGGGKGVGGDCNGVGIAGIVNYVGGNTKGVQLSGLFNKTKGVDDYLLQVGLINLIKNIPDGESILQIGLYNRAGNKIVPLVNPVGMKHLINKVKDKWNARKSLEDEVSQ